MAGCLQVERHESGLGPVKTGTEIGFDQSAGVKRLVDKEGEGGPSAEGLDADRPGSGKEIKNLAVPYPVAKDIEQSLAYPVAGRPNEGLGRFGRRQFTAAGVAAGDAQGGESVEGKKGSERRIFLANGLRLLFGEPGLDGQDRTGQDIEEEGGK